ncbi:MAG: hypothetical protein JNL82_16855 [Myxococcales bacterium]|nr:hypothetical protein [Myxococcales bacterium]
MKRGKEDASLPEHAVMLLSFIVLAVVVFLVLVRVGRPDLVADEPTNEPASSR